METDEGKLAIFGKWLETGCMDDYVLTIENIVRLNRICLIVSSRAATLAAVEITAIIERQNIITTLNDSIIIGVSGSTFEKYPHMEERVKKVLNHWFGDKVLQRIHLDIAKDRGGIGGALVAMLYSGFRNNYPITLLTF
ncbi:hypothetical protein INT45_014098 [Circinella minor]|uniref:Phosphotransferase n=1 Tax=Circinella minor TaxID=1195481 RepID=A0A8H7VGK9_9FUNG|nr:hypothetical protein INT45_014098 [Circinella minor]